MRTNKRPCVSKLQVENHSYLSLTTITDRIAQRRQVHQAVIIFRKSDSKRGLWPSSAAPPRETQRISGLDINGNIGKRLAKAWYLGCNIGKLRWDSVHQDTMSS